MGVLALTNRQVADVSQMVSAPEPLLTQSVRIPNHAGQLGFELAGKNAEDWP